MKRIALNFIFSVLFSIIFSPVLFAQEKAPWESLFNGTDFTNWKKVVCYLTKLTESKVRCNQCNEWKPISQIYKVLLGGGICTTCEEEKNEQND